MDLTGCRILEVKVKKGTQAIIAHIPMVDTGGVVTYTNPHTGSGIPRCLFDPPLETTDVLECIITDSLGRPYNFHGVGYTMVFEVTVS